MKGQPQHLENVARNGGNVFAELVHMVEVCLVAPEAESADGSLRQITACFTGVVGKFQPLE